MIHLKEMNLGKVAFAVVQNKIPNNKKISKTKRRSDERKPKKIYYRWLTQKTILQKHFHLNGALLPKKNLMKKNGFIWYQLESYTNVMCRIRIKT